jgi:hypothetical protein
MRAVAIICGAMLTLVMGGCSATRLGYNNAPGLMFYWLDSYYDFDSKQSVAMKESLKTLQDWHRKEELPRIGEVLKNLQPAARQDVTPEQVCTLYDYLLLRVQAPLERLAPALATMATTLSPAQMTHIAKEFDKRNQQWREEWLDAPPAQRSERRVKQIVERAETFYGKLSDAQRAQIKVQLDAAGYDPALQYTEILRRQQDSLQTLGRVRSGQLTEPQAAAEMQAMLTRSIVSPDPATRQYAEKIVRQSCVAVAAIHNSSNPGQREKLLQALRSYEADATALMQQR